MFSLPPSDPSDSCLAYTNCSSCAEVDGCQWLSSSSEMKCTSHNSTANVTSDEILDPGLCDPFADRCSRYSTCEDCTTAGCFHSLDNSCSLEPVNFSTSSKCVEDVHGSLPMYTVWGWIVAMSRSCNSWFIIHNHPLGVEFLVYDVTCFSAEI